ncbi:hypothetical protein M9H77_02966 [Catharanthus roseus]|uniref:Uncharacterized protein n=1 Tax=Catharanthus roseus TaxID=4058 RepID=A0ACC0CAB8_CATRO|nr:hypothetical protein M9H77_02966 [Catharanthus roseus]
MPMLEGKKTMKKEVIAGVEGQEKEKAKEWQLKVSGRDISFHDRMLNTILGTPKNGIRFYTENKKCVFIPTYIGREDLKNYSLNEKFLRGMMTEIQIYNKHTFKRMGFSRNEEGMLVRGGQDDNDESDEDDEGNEGQEAMNVDEEESEEKPKQETFRREMRQKNMSQLIDMIASLQASMNSRFDTLDGKISNIQERFYKKKRCTKGVSRIIYKEAKDHSRLQDFIKMK